MYILPQWRILALVWLLESNTLGAGYSKIIEVITQEPEKGQFFWNVQGLENPGLLS